MGEAVKNLEVVPSITNVPAIEQVVQNHQAQSANDSYILSKKEEPKVFKGWSAEFSLTSFHYGGSKKSQERNHNNKNFGLGFERIIKNFDNSNLSFSFGAYQNSFHNIPKEQIPEPDAQTISPYVFLGYKYKFSQNVQCGVEGGLVQYFGNMKKMQVNELFNSVNIDASVAVLPTCDFKIAKGFGVSVGFFPGDELSSGEVSSVVTLQMRYDFKH